MGSGLIYAFLVVLWGAYFIPRWLRRHEELSETRSVERFDEAMRILSRNDPVGDQRYLVTPNRPGEPAGDRRPSAVGARRPRVSPVTLRRRRVLALLLLTTVVTTVLAPLTPLPWWSAVLVLLGTLAFLVHCRLQVRASKDVNRAREAVRRRSLSRLMRFDAFERLMAVRREMAADRAAEEQRWAEMEAADRRIKAAEGGQEPETVGGWSPVPVPLPTYVTKPMAPRRAAAAPVATAGRSPEQAEVQPQPVPQQQAHQPGRAAPMSALLDDADEADGQLEAILRRAVND